MDTQYSSGEFTQFGSSYGFSHVTSSPRYTDTHRAMGKLNVWYGQFNDLYFAVLSYHTTSLPWHGRSPAELCMGRNICSTVPQAKSLLIPQWSYLPEFRKENADFKQKQKAQFHHQHRVSEHVYELVCDVILQKFSSCISSIL